MIYSPPSPPTLSLKQSHLDAASAVGYCSSRPPRVHKLGAARVALPGCLEVRVHAIRKPAAFP